MSLNLLGTGTARTIKNFQDSDFKNVLSSILYPVNTGGSTSTPTVNGRVFLTTTAPTTTTQNIQLIPNATGSLSGTVKNYTWSSSNTGICTVDSKGFVTYVANGTATLFCSTDSPFNRVAFTFTFTSTGGTTTSVFQNWAVVSPISLPAHMNLQIDGLIAAAGSFSSAKQNLYSSINDTTGAYVRNTSVWTGSVDLSGIPAWSSYGTTVFYGALITPTDMIVASHTIGAFGAGTRLRFVDPSNVTYTATTAGSATVNGDLSVVHLTWTTLPTTLKVMTVLPSSYQTYCNDHLLNFFPVICTNQFRQVFVQDSLQTSSGSTSAFSNGSFGHVFANETTRSPWTLNIIGGDSSNPVMAVINGAPTLLCCNYTASSGPSVADNITAINTALSSLGSAYAVTTTNLTSPIAFPTY